MRRISRVLFGRPHTSVLDLNSLSMLFMILHFDIMAKWPHSHENVSAFGLTSNEEDHTQDFTVAPRSYLIKPFQSHSHRTQFMQSICLCSNLLHFSVEVWKVFPLKTKVIKIYWNDNFMANSIERIIWPFGIDFCHNFNLRFLFHQFCIFFYRNFL